MAINGNNILIYVNGAVVAGTRSNEVQVGRDMIEIANPDDGQWKKFIAGRKEWSISVAWLVTSYADINKLLIEDSEVTVRIGGRGQSGGLVGGAIVQTCKMTLTRGNLANGSLVLKGSGALASAT